MALLGTYTYAATLSVAGNAAACVAHGLPTLPDWAVYQPTGTTGAAVCLVTRGADALYFHNSGGSATGGEAVAQFVHSIIR